MGRVQPKGFTVVKVSLAVGLVVNVTIAGHLWVKDIVHTTRQAPVALQKLPMTLAYQSGSGSHRAPPSSSGRFTQVELADSTGVSAIINALPSSFSGYSS